MGKITTKGWVEIPREKLVKASWNYKMDDEEKAQKLIANIKRNGQVENIIVRLLTTGYYEVVNGNHRLDVFEVLGTPKVICFNLGTVTQAVAQRLAVETNETRFNNDSVALAKLIKEISQDDDAEFTYADLAETMPFSEDDLQGMVKLLDFDWGQFDKKHDVDDDGESSVGDAPDGKKMFVCPECGAHIDRDMLLKDK